jgi:hypothetical protein
MAPLGLIFALMVSPTGDVGGHGALALGAVHVHELHAAPGSSTTGDRRPLDAVDIPHFARRFDLPCSACHVSPPKLNEFGEDFVRRNYRLPGREERRTIPLAIWVSSRADLPPAQVDRERRVKAYINRIEVVSGGQVAAPWLSYFVEWRPLSLEVRGDGTLRDRSGRFEDLFFTAQWDRVEVSVGQFRQVAQVDISRRLGVNEPGFFSSGLSGAGGDSRTGPLRSFSLSGRAPTVRVGWLQEVGTGWEWTSYLSVSVPGELSLPLTSEARVEASNEIEIRPKGVFVESFVRRGLDSYGVHGFFDSRDRYLVGLVTTGRRGSVLWTGAVGGAGLDGSFRGRTSLEGEVIANRFLAFGARVEKLAGTPAAFVPYLNAHFPGTSYTFRLTLEHRERSGSRGTFLELGTVF